MAHPSCFNSLVSSDDQVKNQIHQRQECSVPLNNMCGFKSFPPCCFTSKALGLPPENAKSVDNFVNPKNPDYSADPQNQAINSDYSVDPKNPNYDEHVSPNCHLALKELIKTSRETNTLLGDLLPYLDEIRVILRDMEEKIMNCTV